METLQASLLSERRENVEVIRPQLPQTTLSETVPGVLEHLLHSFLVSRKINDFVSWYYTPMALNFTAKLKPAAIVYDCMDELAAFQGAPRELQGYEAELLKKADVVFTGGRSLYESKVKTYPKALLFPSSIDRAHFASARTEQAEPEDQVEIPHPRAGFYGVLDERLDRELLAALAKLRPEIHFVMIGPVVKIRLEDLPQADNLHYLGKKSYRELPAYLAGWDVAILPFALNEATRFISPTKTPEYLAAGRPVVSTPIRDVVRDYGDCGLVAIAATPEEFADALDHVVSGMTEGWASAVDAVLAANSWDQTWSRMWSEVEQVLRHKNASLNVEA